MDGVVGLNAATVDALTRLTGNPRLAWDSYRRLVQGYAEIVTGLPTAPFESLVAARMAASEAESERELNFRDLRALTGVKLACYLEQAGTPFPADPMIQLVAATQAVSGPGCGQGDQLPPPEPYRRRGRHGRDGPDHGVRQRRGASGAGVGFTRDPATGARRMRSAY